MRRTHLLLPILLLAPGCAAKAVFDVATLPVKAAGKAVDLATTSQDEADLKRGREMRKAEERERKEEKKREKEARQRED
jgi:hypothetical protein